MNTTSPKHADTLTASQASGRTPNVADDVDTAPSETTPAAPAHPTPEKAPHFPNAAAQRDAAESKRTGTHVLPMPSDSPDVAGLPRSDRAHTAPGDPGNIAPEDQVAADKPVDSTRR